MNQQKLISWYQENHRILPWRDTKDAYKIWLSEIILQQTRVAQGLPYFEKFISNFPELKNLAEASEEQILKLWQGLGYYSRGRNLHFTAKFIVDHLNGDFPDSYQELLKLKGIGSYTAAAIASFAYNESVAVLDGNVFRVLSRFYGIDEPINTGKGKKLFENLAADFLDKSQPALHNQAIMELGALVCLPQNPKCIQCPIHTNCKARELDLIHLLPVKLKKSAVKEKFFYYFHLVQTEKLACYKRPSGGIWHNLFDLPLIEYSQKPSSDQLIEDVNHILGFRISKQDVNPNWEQTHILTHQKINAFFIRFEPNPQVEVKYLQPLIWVSKADLHKLPVSRLLEKYLHYIYG